MKFKVVEYEFSDGVTPLFVGTKEACEKYVKDRDKGYAGIRPLYSIQEEKV